MILPKPEVVDQLKKMTHAEAYIIPKGGKNRILSEIKMNILIGIKNKA